MCIFLIKVHVNCKLNLESSFDIYFYLVLFANYWKEARVIGTFQFWRQILQPGNH